MPTENERLMLIEHTLWGRQGTNGIVGDLKAHRVDFQQFVAAEAARREAEAKEKAKAQRLVALAALAAVVSLIGVVVNLLVFLTAGSPA